jgi:hypothetical protein
MMTSASSIIFLEVAMDNGWTNSRAHRFQSSDPARNNADWNDQELEDLARSYLRGDSIRVLADRHQRKPGAIECRIGRVAAKLAPDHLKELAWQ